LLIRHSLSLSLLFAPALAGRHKSQITNHTNKKPCHRSGGRVEGNSVSGFLPACLAFIQISRGVSLGLGGEPWEGGAEAEHLAVSSPRLTRRLRDSRRRPNPGDVPTGFHKNKAALITQRRREFN
jgi:hypothetical protein